MAQQLSFKERLEAAKAAQATGRDLANQFGVEIPVGTYVGKLQAYSYQPSSKGRPLIKHSQYILEGEQAGNVATEYIGLEHEVAVAIVTRFVSEMGYEMPDIFDFEASERNGDFVISKEFADTLSAIESAEPTVRFMVQRKGEFTNLKILEIVSVEGGDGEPQIDDPQEEVPADEEVPVDDVPVEDEVPAEEVPEEEVPQDDDPQKQALLDLCESQNITEVTAEMSTEDIINLLRADYVFWTKKVALAQLKEFNGATPADGLTDDQVAVLEEAGLSEIIIYPVAPKAKAPAPKAAPAPASKVPAKAPAKTAPVPAPAKAPAKVPAKAPAPAGKAPAKAAHASTARRK